ncbi:hypothetical protein C8Q78DRAFT_1022322 [Trametes maxima]|nr:hypothetical protein C8Q78DRAFT_1022322 [Trametes maxima]
MVPCACPPYVSRAVCRARPLPSRRLAGRSLSEVRSRDLSHPSPHPVSASIALPVGDR